MSILTSCAWIDEIGKDKSQAEFRLMPNASAADDDRFLCAQKQFPIHLYHFETNAPQNTFTTIGMYTSIVEKMFENSVFIQFVEVNADTLENCPDPSTLIGSDIELGINSCVRASFLLAACDNPIVLRITGKFHLDSFSTERGGQMAGSLNGTLEYVEYIESSTDKLEHRINLGTAEGEFSFINKAGAVWEHGRVAIE